MQDKHHICYAILLSPSLYLKKIKCIKRLGQRNVGKHKGKEREIEVMINCWRIFEKLKHSERGLQPRCKCQTVFVFVFINCKQVEKI